MNLDWDFFFDNWLIDKIPDGFEVKIEEHPSGISINPPELYCYFGANPIYMYGLGKLYHEVLMSPTGITIYPEFLDRPGFEFVEEITFKADFEEELDFFGNSVKAKHVGYVNATDYMNNILKTIYGVAEGEYVGQKTPSSKLRKVTGSDLDLITKSFENYQVFNDAQDMRDNGCTFYMHGYGEDDRGGPYDLITGNYMNAVAPGALINTPGTFSDVLFLRYTYIEITEYAVSAISSSNFQILFSTTEEFRAGTVFDFGSTNKSTPPNYGFKLIIEPSGVTIVMNDGNYNSFSIPYLIDFRFPHRFSLIRTDDSVFMFIDGKIMGEIDTSSIGNIIFDSNRPNLISGEAGDTTSNSPAGDLEEVAFFSMVVDSEKISKYYDDVVPLIKAGGIDQQLYENAPVALSYDLTYSKPTNIFIPNFFGANFNNFYLVDSNGIVNVIGDYPQNDSYLTGYEPTENKSILVKNGFRISSVTTHNYEEFVDFYVGERIPVLTKLTSDVHIPLRIYMKFRIPEFHSNKIVYNIRLVLKSLDKFLWYSYKKYKTGEFV